MTLTWSSIVVLVARGLQCLYADRACVDVVARTHTLTCYDATVPVLRTL